MPIGNVGDQAVSLDVGDNVAIARWLEGQNMPDFGLRGQAAVVVWGLSINPVESNKFVREHLGLSVLHRAVGGLAFIMIA